MIHLLYGADAFGCQEALAALIDASSTDPAMAELNRTRLDGRTLTLPELQHHCDAIPFLAERRMVIVTGLLSRLEGQSQRKEDDSPPAGEEANENVGAKKLLDALLAYLEQLSPTTDLVFFEPGLEKKKMRGRVLKWVQKAGAKIAQEREFLALRETDLIPWLVARAKRHGAGIRGDAAASLVEACGNDLAELNAELEKLSLYVEPGEQITREHVRRLVPRLREASIFTIVDAIGERRWNVALRELHKLLEEGVHPLQALGMINRQYRLIVQAQPQRGVRETEEELARRLGVHKFVAGKARAQAERYSPEQLIAIYDRLFEMDLAIKTSKMDAALALEMFVAGQSPAK